MPISKKIKQAVADAIRSASIAALDEHMPRWSETPPESMSEVERKLFDAITDVERLATQKVAQVLA